MRSALEVRDGRPVVVRAGKGDAADAVRREARTLAAIAGVGAPRVIEFDDDGEHVSLVLAVGPPSSLDRAPPSVVFDALARVAEVLQRAAFAGIAHGPIHDEDILADGPSVILAGWHRATDADPRRDMTEFGRLVEKLAARHRDLAPIATRALALDPPTFAALAGTLRAGIRPEREVRRARAPWGLAIVVTLVCIGVGASVVPHRSGAGQVLLDAPARVTVHGNVVERAGHRWAVGELGDIVVTGAWQCDGEILPAVLRRSVGRVWLFTSWPSGGAPVMGRQATDVPGASRLRVEHDGRCDHLRVVDAQGRVTTVR